MKKIYKRAVALVLIVALLCLTTSCGKKDTPEVTFDNPQEGMTYAEVMDAAEGIGQDQEYETEGGNTFEIKSIKARKLVFSGVAAIISVITTLIATIFGGISVTPGYVRAGKGNKILVVKLEYTNNTDETVMIGDVLHTAFAVEGEDVYDGTLCCAKGMSLDYSGTKEVKPGKTVKVKLLFEGIPKELFKEDYEFNIYFDVEGELYSLSYAG